MKNILGKFSFALLMITLASCGRNPNLLLSNLQIPPTERLGPTESFNSYYMFTQPPSSPYDIVLILDRSLSSDQFLSVESAVSSYLLTLKGNGLDFHFGILDSSGATADSLNSNLVGTTPTISSADAHPDTEATATIESLRIGASVSQSLPIQALVQALPTLNANGFFRSNTFHTYVIVTANSFGNTLYAHSDQEVALNQLDAATPNRNWNYSVFNFSIPSNYNEYDYSTDAFQQFVNFGNGEYVQGTTDLTSFFSSVQSQMTAQSTYLIVRSILPSDLLGQEIEIQSDNSYVSINGNQSSSSYFDYWRGLLFLNGDTPAANTLISVTIDISYQIITINP